MRIAQLYYSLYDLLIYELTTHLLKCVCATDCIWIHIQHIYSSAYIHSCICWIYIQL